MSAPAPMPIPDAVADFKIRQWTRSRREVEVAYSNAERSFRLCRTEWTREAREYAIADMARTGKHLGQLPQRIGGAW
jgi:hypothetical protein